MATKVDRYIMFPWSQSECDESDAIGRYTSAFSANECAGYPYAALGDILSRTWPQGILLTPISIGDITYYGTPQP